MPRVASPSTPVPSLLVSVSEASHLLGLSPNTVYEMCASGELKTVATGRRGRLIPRSEIERFASIEQS